MCFTSTPVHLYLHKMLFGQCSFSCVVAQYSWTDVSWVSRWEHGSSPMSSQASLNEQTRVQPFTYNIEMCTCMAGWCTCSHFVSACCHCGLKVLMAHMGALQVWHTLTVRLAHFASGVRLPTPLPPRVWLSGSYFLSGYFSNFKTRVNLMLLNVNDLVAICEQDN